MKKDSTIKIIGLAVLAIVVLWLLKAILLPTGYGMSISYGMQDHMGRGYGYSYGMIGFGGSLTILLAFIIKVLITVFTVTLLVGLVMLLVKHVFTKENVASIKNTFAAKSEGTSKVCIECDKNLDEEWKICPHCGKEVDKL